MSLKNQESKVIKVILPARCPHCGKDMSVAVKTITPTIDWALREEDLQKAKEKVIKEISESDITSVEKKAALDWVNHKDTLFGPEEVQHILAQIIKKDDEKEKDTDKNQD